MLIVSGRLLPEPERQDRCLAGCEPSIRSARRAPGCLDFAGSASTVGPDRADVYEAWTDARSLQAFRNSDGEHPCFSVIVDVRIERHEVSHGGTP